MAKYLLKVRYSADGIGGVMKDGGTARRAAIHFTLTTTLPLARPVSTYAMASLMDSNGKTRSTTGRMARDSMRGVICRNWSPLALMKRNE